MRLFLLHFPGVRSIQLYNRVLSRPLRVLLAATMGASSLRWLFGYSLPMMAVALAGILGWLIAYLNAPDLIINLVFGITESPFSTSLLIVLFLLLLGTFLSTIICIIVLYPIIQAMEQAAELAPLHLGIIVVLTLSLGRVTPPYGICMLVASQIAELPSHKVFLTSIPMIILTLLIIIVGILIPDPLSYPA